MAEFTAEQQAAIDAEVARIIADREYIDGVEEERRNHDITLETRRAKLELVRIAKETLVENQRSKPVDEREIDANSIVSFANVIVSYVNSN